MQYSETMYKKIAKNKIFYITKMYKLRETALYCVLKGANSSLLRHKSMS